MKKIEHSNHTVLTLQSGKTLALANSPKSKEASEVTGIIEKAIAALDLLEELKASVAADQMLSPAGRQAKVDQFMPTAIAEIADAAQRLAEFGDYVQADEKNTFAPPPLDKTDAVSALADMELRSYLRGLEGDALHAAMKELVSQPRIQEAILRSPVPMGQLTDLARANWGQRITSNDPHVKELQAARTALEWAKGSLPHIAQHAVDGADRVKLLADVVALGKPAAAAVFGFTNTAVAESARRAEAMTGSAA